MLGKIRTSLLFFLIDNKIYNESKNLYKVTYIIMISYTNHSKLFSVYIQYYIKRLKGMDQGQVFNVVQNLNSEFAGFPLGKFVRANREKSNLIGWRQTLTTSPANHIRFLLVRAASYPGSSQGRKDRGAQGFLGRSQLRGEDLATFPKTLARPCPCAPAAVVRANKFTKWKTGFSLRYVLGFRV